MYRRAGRVSLVDLAHLFRINYHCTVVYLVHTASLILLFYTVGIAQASKITNQVSTLWGAPHETICGRETGFVLCMPRRPRNLVSVLVLHSRAIQARDHQPRAANRRRCNECNAKRTGCTKEHKSHSIEIRSRV